MPYVKLDEMLLGSSVWFCDHATFRVWIYLLLAADASGIVSHTVPKIAHDCKVSPKVVRAALESWQSPDPDSRSPDREGRRVEVVREPEWQIRLVNFAKYRKKDHTAAERKRRQRERERTDAEPSQRDNVTRHTETRPVTQADADAETDAETDAQPANGQAEVAVEKTKPGRTREQFGLPGVPRPKAAQAAIVGEGYLRAFNSAFDRRVGSVSMQKAVTRKIVQRLADGIEGELLVALPILARADEGADFLGADPLILLRDGKNARTRDGTTFGATDHALAYAGRLDSIVLPRRLTLAARAAGVADWLEAQGVRLLQPAEDGVESRA